MFWFDTDKHKMPHFHARYSDFSAVFDLKGNVIAGSLGLTGNRLVKEWAEARKTELKTAWQPALAGKELPWIKPIQ